MIKEQNENFEKYFGFETPDDYESFVIKKIDEYKFVFVNKDIRGPLYKNSCGIYMKCRKDSHDGSVTIWSSKK